MSYSNSLGFTPQFFAGTVENAAYSKGLQQGGLNKRNDGQLSMDELNRAIRQGHLNPKMAEFAKYVKANFAKFDKSTTSSGNIGNIGWSGTNPPNGKLSFNELSTAMANYHPTKTSQTNPNAPAPGTNPYGGPVGQVRPFG